MKKKGIINADIASVLAYLGHMDKIAIGDAGLPVPDHVLRIDLAVKPGLPRFQDVLETVLDDMHVETIYLAEELKTMNPTMHQTIQTLCPDTSTEYMPHARFKEDLNDCKAVIRTGEVTPYSNIILQSNVFFNSGE